MERMNAKEKGQSGQSKLPVLRILRALHDYNCNIIDEYIDPKSITEFTVYNERGSTHWLTQLKEYGDVLSAFRLCDIVANEKSESASVTLTVEVLEFERAKSTVHEQVLETAMLSMLFGEPDQHERTLDKWIRDVLTGAEKEKVKKQVVMELSKDESTWKTSQQEVYSLIDVCAGGLLTLFEKIKREI